MPFFEFNGARSRIGTGELIDNAEADIQLAYLKNRGVHEAEAMVILVNSDCIVSNDAYSTESIKHSCAALHIDAPATPGRIGVFWDERDDHLIIKGIGEGTENYIILYPETATCQSSGPAKIPN